jgi:hypothetical protein
MIQIMRSRNSSAKNMFAKMVTAEQFYWSGLSNLGSSQNSEKLYAKCENSAHSDVKCTLIMAKVVASEIRQI